VGLANNGFGDDALNVFHAMLTEGFKPNGVLIACANRNLVQKGLDHLESIKSVHNLEPQMKHYGCVVHLLGRDGQLEKAEICSRDAHSS
jgi:pentatricopeptide repeat protein